MAYELSGPDDDVMSAGLVARSEMRRGQKRLHSSDNAVLDALTGHINRFRRELSANDRLVLDAIIGTRNAAVAALGACSIETVLDEEGRTLVEALARYPMSRDRTLPTQIVLIMKATRYCNLRCTYCRSWSDGPDQSMPFDVLAHTIHSALTAPGVLDVKFVWHGGETTLRPIRFYERALWLQERFRQPGQTISNVIQTNGTRLTDEWLEFLRLYEFGVGVSLDGPPEIHDARRRDAQGRATSAVVVESIKRLAERGIRFGVLMVVDEDVIRVGPQVTLDYLLATGVHQVSLLNVTPEGVPAGDAKDEPYLEYRTFVEYLRAMFRLWYPKHVDDISILEIADLRNMLEGRRRVSCVHGPNCVGRFFTIEANGDIGHCDKYQQNPDFCFGNILKGPLATATKSPVLHRAHAFTAAGLDRCRPCRWYGVCQGGCPYDRYVRIQREGTTHDERCCGLSPLLDEMSEAIVHHAGAGALVAAPAAQQQTNA